MNRTEILKAYQEELNRIGKSEKTVNGYLFNVEKFLDWIEETSGEAFDNINNLSNVFREDEVVKSYSSEEILSNAPEQAENHFLVRNRE